MASNRIFDRMSGWLGFCGRDHATALQRVMESNPDYALRIGGATPTPDSADDVLTSLPPGVEPAHKVVIGLWEGETLIAFADVIVGWPSPDAAHIGLLMTDGERHGQGLGRRMHDAVLDHLMRRPQLANLRLSIVDSNADVAEPFWVKLGYEPTGEAV